MEDRFVKDFDLSFDNQLLVDYEIEIRNEIKSLLDDIKKENYLFNQMVNRREASFWEDIIKEVSHYVVEVHSKEKLKRLTKNIYQYKSLCDMSEKICKNLKDVERIKSSIVGSKKPL